VQKVEETECGTRPDGLLRGGVEATAEKLDMLWDCARAAAILQSHFVDTVGVENKKTGVTCNGAVATGGVVELHCEPN